ncbi:hypothetical protein KAX21_01330 [candidate division WOR-3 bacterium]|nr:hypothetical protein [candidate division WOR-3 bacterium]
MQDKFNFHDFVAYIIPGGLALIVVYWFLVSFVGLSLPIQVKSLGESILFLAGSYFFGHLVQVLGTVIEKRQRKKWGGNPSELMLRKDYRYYSVEFLIKLKKAVKDTFAMTFETDSVNEDSNRQRNETFKLCYALTITQNVCRHTEIFNGIYSLCRGIIATACISIVMIGAIGIKQLLLLILPCINVALPQGKFWEYDSVTLGLSAALLLIFVLAVWLLKSRFREFALRFVDSVYRNFYTWYSTTFIANKKK